MHTEPRYGEEVTITAHARQAQYTMMSIPAIETPAPVMPHQLSGTRSTFHSHSNATATLLNRKGNLSLTVFPPSMGSENYSY